MTFTRWELLIRTCVVSLSALQGLTMLFYRHSVVSCDYGPYRRPVFFLLHAYLVSYESRRAVDTIQYPVVNRRASTGGAVSLSFQTTGLSRVGGGSFRAAADLACTLIDTWVDGLIDFHTPSHPRVIQLYWLVRRTQHE